MIYNSVPHDTYPDSVDKSIEVSKSRNGMYYQRISDT